MSRRADTAIVVSPMVDDDREAVSVAFLAIGWQKPVSQYDRYLLEQRAGDRMIFVARVERSLAGYVTLLWRPAYVPFRERGIPEIQDLNVLPAFRRLGAATRLLDAAEAAAASRADVVGIGVCLHGDYGPAQRLYVRRGYVPDGRGVAYNGRAVAPLESVTVDDHLALYLTKVVRFPA